MKTSVDTALKDIADFYVKNRRLMTEPEFEAILLKHCENEAEVRKFAAFLQTEPGQTRFKIHLKERKEGSGEYDKPLALKLHGEMMKELKEPYGGLLTAGKFPKRDEALKKLGQVTIVEVHDDGDLTVRSGGKLYVVTTDGKAFEQTASYLKEGRYVVVRSTGSTLSWESWLKDLQGYQKMGETPPDVEYPPLKCKYCGAVVPKEHLKGIEPETWAGYHIKGHKDAVKELVAKRLPWSAGLVPIETPSYLKEAEEEKLLKQIEYWQKVQNERQKRDVEDFTIAIRDMGLVGLWARYNIPRLPGKTIGSYYVAYEPAIGDIIEHLLVSRRASYLKEATAVAETECQLISPQYYDVLTWFNVPVPDYSFAIEPEVKERKIDEVLQKLKDGVSRIHESSIFREFLTTMAKFWEYSFGNQILIMLQRPGATRVAGFVTWKDLGRHVKFGEKGIAILAPCLPPRILKCPLCEKTFTESDLRRHLSEVHQRRDVSSLIREAREEAVGIPTPTYFKVVSVFDVSQTEGKPLPEIAVPVLSGAYSEALYSKLMQLASKHSLVVSFEPRPEQNPEIKGMLLGKVIWVKGDEPEAQRLKTLAHEVAHYFTEAVYLIPRADAEVIAESVSFVVCAHFGFDSGTRSFPYVALWAKEKKVLEQNLASIRKISGRMIEELG